MDIFVYLCSSLTSIRTMFSAFVLCLLAMVSLGMKAQQPMVMPMALKAGDTIAIISPSSAPDETTIAKGCATLRQWGYVPVVGAHALSEYHGFAGTADSGPLTCCGLCAIQLSEP